MVRSVEQNHLLQRLNLLYQGIVPFKVSVSLYQYLRWLQMLSNLQLLIHHATAPKVCATARLCVNCRVHNAQTISFRHRPADFCTKYFARLWNNNLCPLQNPAAWSHPAADQRELASLEAPTRVPRSGHLISTRSACPSNSLTSLPSRRTFTNLRASKNYVSSNDFFSPERTALCVSSMIPTNRACSVLSLREKRRIYKRREGLHYLHTTWLYWSLIGTICSQAEAFTFWDLPVVVWSKYTRSRFPRKKTVARRSTSSQISFQLSRL